MANNCSIKLKADKLPEVINKVEYFMFQAMKQNNVNFFQVAENPSFHLESLLRTAKELMEKEMTSYVEEAKTKLSSSLKGIKHKPHKKHKSWKWSSPSKKGPEYHLYGKTQSSEHILKRSKTRPEGTGKKISEKLKGKQHTQEAKQKISQKNSVPIIQLDKMGNFIKEWNSMVEAGRQLGLNRCDISNACNRRQKTAGGFIWEYKIL